MNTKPFGRIRRAALVVAGTLLSASAVLADDAATKERIAARIEDKLAQQAQVQVEVQDGVAVLSGFTTTVAAQREAGRLAGKESKKVDNQIRVVPLERSDADLAHAVSGAVLDYVHYNVFDSVALAVDHGVVTLQGSVRQPWHRQDIESRVAEIEGIRELRNEIRVQPVSTFDDRLRAELYARIYGTRGG